MIETLKTAADSYTLGSLSVKDFLGVVVSALNEKQNEVTDDTPSDEAVNWLAQAITLQVDLEESVGS